MASQSSRKCNCSTVLKAFEKQKPHDLLIALLIQEKNSQQSSIMSELTRKMWVLPKQELHFILMLVYHKTKG